ncbi:uncharacterized protein A4U43_C06F14020 [Asparagus officinalis]|uniref:Late embryogenesis abundant protein LEA-2 subgroup domain-containing protein n=1 Tax=Asparagus officinalis TaxID=4686 RepID=A0A5P1ESD3_ASPOF|nr:uncharacterized protein A4U43_C06F14020 [Asparagus officinalis]
MANATGTVMAYGYLNLTSSTDVKGRVSVIGVFKGDIGVVMNCSMSLDWPLASKRVKYRVCEAYVELRPHDPLLGIAKNNQMCTSYKFNVWTNSSNWPGANCGKIMD